MEFRLKDIIKNKNISIDSQLEQRRLSIGSNKQEKSTD
jgi:hypothetical protein